MPESADPAIIWVIPQYIETPMNSMAKPYNAIMAPKAFILWTPIDVALANDVARRTTPRAEIPTPQARPDGVTIPFDDPADCDSIW